MGFDIECIIDIHTYPGEYFCPVCRTLVYPNEALQSQCTHLYCKPCLAHVANNTRACPYDGYLVTEPDSKPLLESDKTLAENIGKVKVRCLYHRSGCTWEGPLSDCTSHCSGCTFGNSPVICNRCSIQIVHRQVHDHQQSCLGVHQVQQAADATQNATSSGPTVATTGVSQNQPTIQSGAPSSQVQNSQNAPGPMLPVQDSNQQTNASSQAPAAVPAAPTPTPEQSYQQQYQQYYQHYAGYTHYQQAYQQYYPYQQSSVQQLQQQPVAHGGQPQLQVYSQAPMHSQPQSQVQPLPHSQSQPQQLIQYQAQPVQTQTGQPQAQVQQGHSQPIPHVQAVQTQNHPQVTPQQHVHHTMQPHAQTQSQFSLPHGFTAPQSQAHLMQPQPQHAQVLQYQQHLQPPQVQLQPHLPQAQLLTQPHSQLQQPGCPPVLARSEVHVHPPAQVRPQGPGLLPHPRNPMNPSDKLQPPLLKQPPDVPLGGVPPPGSVQSFKVGPGYFNASCAPPSVAVDRRDGIIGRAPQNGSEGQFGPPHFVNPVEADIIQSQKLNPLDGGQSRLLGSFGRGPSGPSLNGEPSSFRMDGGTGYDSYIRSHDENRFPPFPSFQRRGGFDGREHVPPGPHNNLRRGDMFRHDTPPSHFRRGELAPGNSPGHLRLGDPTTFGPFPGRTRVGELPAPGNLPYNTCFGDSFLGSKTSLPRLGEPGFRSSFSHGFPNDGPYGVDPFDNARKRKPVSMGWCRICKVDCETVEGLDMHSQSRGHQKMALDMVMSIKQQNKKKHRGSSDHAVREETNKTKNTGMEGRGNKP